MSCNHPGLIHIMQGLPPEDTGVAIFHKRAEGYPAVNHNDFNIALVAGGQKIRPEFRFNKNKDIRPDKIQHVMNSKEKYPTENK